MQSIFSFLQLSAAMRSPLVAVLLLAVLPACGWLSASGSGEADDVPAEVVPGEPFWLDVGETAYAPGNVTLTFLNLVDDSRCPEGVACVWEGQAHLLVGWSAPNVRTHPVTVVVGAVRDGDTQQVGPFRVLALDPLPQSEGPAPEATAYRAQFVLE